MTALLRDAARECRSWPTEDATGSVADSRAAAEAADVLDRLADQIDAECIALAEPPR